MGNSSPELRKFRSYLVREAVDRHKRVGKVMTAVVLATGLLTISTFPAIYGAYVSPANTALQSSGANTTQSGNSILGFGRGSPASGYYSFRVLCTFSFVSSIISIFAATVVLYQVPVSDKKGYSKIAYHVALIFFLTTLLTVSGAALVGTLSFLDFAYGISTIVVLGIGLIVMLTTLSNSAGRRSQAANRKFEY